MAKITVPESDDIKVELFVPEEKPGLYAAHVQKLIDADAQRTPEQVEKNLHNSVVVLFPTTETKNRMNKETGEKEPVQIDALPKYKRFFQDSARALDRTAREVESIDQGDGFTAVRFVVVPKVSKPRGAKGDTFAD